MNKTINNALVLVMAVLLTSSSWAQETSDQSANEQAKRTEQQVQVDEMMDTLAEEMAAIRGAKSQKERHALMATHQQHMREAMGLMRDMGGMHMREVMTEHMGPSMEPKPGAEHRRHWHKRTAPIRPREELSNAQRLTDLENRLDMMQVIIESLMEGQGKQ
jgi:hypothetical protein